MDWYVWYYILRTSKCNEILLSLGILCECVCVFGCQPHWTFEPMCVGFSDNELSRNIISNFSLSKNQNPPTNTHTHTYKQANKWEALSIHDILCKMCQIIVKLSLEWLITFRCFRLITSSVGEWTWAQLLWQRNGTMDIGFFFRVLDDYGGMRGAVSIFAPLTALRSARSLSAHSTFISVFRTI